MEGRLLRKTLARMSQNRRSHADPYPMYPLFATGPRLPRRWTVFVPGADLIPSAVQEREVLLRTPGCVVRFSAGDSRRKRPASSAALCCSSALRLSPTPGPASSSESTAGRCAVMIPSHERPRPSGASLPDSRCERRPASHPRAKGEESLRIPDGHFIIPQRQQKNNLPTIRIEIQAYSFFTRKLFVCFRSAGWTPP